MDDGEMPEIRTNQWAFSYPRFPVQRERIVALLLNAGADPNHASNGDSYLFLALYDHSLPSVKALLAHGADPNGSYGLSPLLNKAIENDAELHAIGNDESPVYTQAMLAAGANAHLRRTYVGGSGSVFVEEPPLLVAAYDADDFHYQGGDPALIETLLAHGADINGRNQMGKTALLVAAAQGDAEIVRILLAHGAAPDMVNRQGHTALQVVQTVEASRLALATRSGKPLKKWLKNALKQRNTSEIQNVEDNIGWNDEAKIRKGYDAVQALLIKAQSAAIH